MAFRLYIVPVIGDGSSKDPRRPKYFADSITDPWSGMDYGLEPWMVVGGDLSVSNDAFVIGQADAFALPFDLAPNLTSQQVTNVQNKLEAINIPAGWVTTSLTWIQVVRSVLGMCTFMQRLVVNFGGRFFNGITLGTRLNQLTQAQRDQIQATADEFQLSTASFAANTTIRVVLKTFADEFGDRPYNFNGTIL